MFAGALHVAALLFVFLISNRQADAAKDSQDIQLAAAFELPQLPKVPALPSLTGHRRTDGSLIRFSRSS
jgi:hypothetical protein